MKATMDFSMLPFDIWREILKFLPFENNCMFNFMLASKQLRKYAILVLGPLDNNFLIRFACEKGYLRLVRELLSNGRVDPSALCFVPITTAVSRNFVDVVMELLHCPRTNPAAFNNFLIRWACEKGYTWFVAELLKDPRVDPSVNNNIPIKFAKAKGYIEIEIMLTRDARVKKLLQS